jgi:DNA-binding NarL/FixJ family response regulator
MAEAYTTTEQAPKARHVVVVDDHALMRETIRDVLAKDSSLEVVAEAKDGLEAIECCQKLRPDLVLMDVQMPRMDGLEATRKIKEELPETSVLFLTAHADHSLLMDAVKAGAAGYVLKGERPENVLDAIRAVLEGGTPLDQGVAMGLLRRMAAEEAAAASSQGGYPPPTTTAQQTIPKSPTQAAAPSLPNPLTPRETEVLARFASGKTNRQVAQELHLSLSTVKRHIDHILLKLAVSDRTQAAVKAIEMGLLPAANGQQNGESP